jgi:hypothetical protein
MEVAFWQHQAAQWAANDIYAAALSCALLVAVLMGTRDGTGAGANGALPQQGFCWQHIGRVLGLLALTLPGLASLAAPRWYRAPSHRTLAIVATRLCTMVLLPTASQLAVGGAFATVRTPAQAFWKLLLGSRVASLAYIALAYPLPLPWLAGIQLVAAARAALESRMQLCRAVPQLASSSMVRRLALGMAAALRRANIFSIAPPVVPAGWHAGGPGGSEWAAREEQLPPAECCFLLCIWMQV